MSIKKPRTEVPGPVEPAGTERQRREETTIKERERERDRERDGHQRNKKQRKGEPAGQMVRAGQGEGVMEPDLQ